MHSHWPAATVSWAFILLLVSGCAQGAEQEVVSTLMPTLTTLPTDTPAPTPTPTPEPVWSTLAEPELVNVTDLAVGPDGALWMGSPLVRYDGQAWEDFSDNPVLRPGKYDPSPEAIAFSDDGTLWLGFGGIANRIEARHEGTLVSWDGESWETHGLRGEVMEGKAADIGFASDGSVWVLIDHSFTLHDPVGIAHYDGERWEVISSEEGFPSNDPTCLAVDHDDVVWVGTNDTELLRYDGETWMRVTHAEGLQGTKIYSLFVDAAGRVWVGTDAGVTVFNGSDWEAYSSKDGLAQDDVYDIEQAPDGALWFATRLGASRLHEGQWRTFTGDDGLGRDFVTDIAVAPDGALWFVQAEGGLSRYGPPQ